MAEYGQDAEMVELFHTVGRIMKMGASSTVTGMRRAANNTTHPLLRPVTALRGGGSSAVSEANGDAYATSPCNTADTDADGSNVVMSELLKAKEQLQRHKRHISMLQAQLLKDKQALMSDPSATSSPVPQPVMSAAGTDGWSRHIRQTAATGSLSDSRHTATQLAHEAMWDEAVSVSPVQILHAKSKRGAIIPIEFIEVLAQEGDSTPAAQQAPAVDKTHSLSLDARNTAAAATQGDELTSPTTDQGVDAPALVGDLQNLAQDFPGCAQYLMNELDSRRYTP